MCNGTEEQLQGAMMEHVISDPYESNQLPLTNPFILAEPTTLINSPLPKYWVTRETGVVPSTYIQTVGTSATSPEYDITTQLSLFDTSDGA
ncbi:hypothetical protein [uncultured Paraglaciecola sp.]|uniref:hypothetical protein n=1 Tax=uncultured Paraglaciecola sp. TaxID=1765024 RepID=UPI00260C92FD|nr:hypothetical protein [uncultured Paraglaciecola sp.]